MTRLPAFAQWLYEFDVPDTIVKQVTDIAFSIDYRLNKTNLTSFVPDTVSLPEMKPIREWIDSTLKEVKVDLNFECDEIKTNIEWFNRSDYGMWHHAHTHDNSFISGLIYLTPSSSETIFSVPNLWGPDYTMLNLISPDNARVFSNYPTTVGKMIVFPSKLLHSVSEHNEEAPRYSLSFNAFPSGLIGTQSEQVYRKFMNITVHQEK